jgi:hypothetical protein
MRRTPLARLIALLCFLAAASATSAGGQPQGAPQGVPQAAPRVAPPLGPAPVEMDRILREAKAAMRENRLADAEALFEQIYEQASDALVAADSHSVPATAVIRFRYEEIQRAALQSLAVLRLDELEAQQLGLAAEIDTAAVWLEEGRPYAAAVRLKTVRAVTDSLIVLLSEIPLSSSRPLALSAQGTSGERLVNFLTETERLQGRIRDHLVATRIKIFDDLDRRLQAALAERGSGARREALRHIAATADSILAERILATEFRTVIEGLSRQAHDALGDGE